MRILVVQESNWLEKGPHQSHHLMERLSEKGHEVRVIDFDILWREKRCSRLLQGRQIFTEVRKATDSGSVTVVRPRSVRMPGLEYLSLLLSHRRELSRQINEYRPDVIVGFGILNAFMSIQLARKSDLPFVYYVIDELHRLIPQRVFRGVGRAIESCNMKNADMVLVINERLRHYSETMGANAQSIRVIPGGVDIRRFAPNSTTRQIMRNRLGFSNDDTVLFFMGWLYEFSGLKEVAAKIADQRRNEPKFKLLIIGDGPLWNDLQKFIGEKALSDVIVLRNWIPYDEVPDFITSSDICILPAQNVKIMKNIVPIKMYEYLAGEKPVIATRLPGIVMEFGDNSGVIYTDGPDDTIRAAIDIVSRNQLEVLQKAAAKSIIKNEWSRLADEFERCLEGVRR